MTTIPLLPVLSRTSPTFKADLDAAFLTGFNAAINGFNTVSGEVQTNATTAASGASTVTIQAESATASAAIASGAAASAGAVAWVSGTTYALGYLVYSPINLQNYRRKVAGAGTTDPSLDAVNWTITTPTMTATTGGAVPIPPNNTTTFLRGDATFAAPPASALVLLATLTPTVAANLDFLDVFSSAYDNYLIIGNGLTVSADTWINMRLATGGAVDSGSDYSIMYGGQPTGNFLSGTASETSFQCTGTVYAGGKGVSFQIDVKNVNQSSSLKSIYAEFMAQSAATPTYQAGAGRSGYIAAKTVSGFRLYTNTSTFAATGKVRVYGYSNT